MNNKRNIFGLLNVFVARCTIRLVGEVETLNTNLLIFLEMVMM
jgi:hypothetical protein